MRKIWVVLLSLFAVVTLAACENKSITIDSGTTNKNVMKVSGKYNDNKVKATLPDKAKYAVVWYNDKVVDSIKADKNHKITFTDHLYEKYSITLYATTKKYDYGDDDKSAIDAIDKVTLKAPSDLPLGRNPWDSLGEDDGDSSSDTDDDYSYDDSDDDSTYEEPFQAADYNTGITFDQLARTPDKYEGKKVKLTGKVLQVLEGDSTNNLRVGIDGDYDNVVLVVYDPDIMDGNRILEDDKVTFYGESQGTTSYEATSGAEITIPEVDAVKIDDAGTAPDNYGY